MAAMIHGARDNGADANERFNKQGVVVDFSLDMQASKLRVGGSRQKIVDGQWRGNVKGIELFFAIAPYKNKGPQPSPEPNVDRASPVLALDYARAFVTLPLPDRLNEEGKAGTHDTFKVRA